MSWADEKKSLEDWLASRVCGTGFVGKPGFLTRLEWDLEDIALFEKDVQFDRNPRPNKALARLVDDLDLEPAIASDFDYCLYRSVLPLFLGIRDELRRGSASALKKLDFRVEGVIAYEPSPLPEFLSILDDLHECVIAWGDCGYFTRNKATEDETAEKLDALIQWLRTEIQKRERIIDH